MPKMRYTPDLGWHEIDAMGSPINAVSVRKIAEEWAEAQRTRDSKAAEKKQLLEMKLRRATADEKIELRGEVEYLGKKLKKAEEELEAQRRAVRSLTSQLRKTEEASCKAVETARRNLDTAAGKENTILRDRLADANNQIKKLREAKAGDLATGDARIVIKCKRGGQPLWGSAPITGVVLEMDGVPNGDLPLSATPAQKLAKKLLDYAFTVPVQV